MVLQEKFPSGMKIFQIPLSWFRKVTSFVNNICGGPGINVAKPPSPSDAAPVMVSIDEEWLDEKIKSSAPTAGDGIDITGGKISIDPDNLGEGTGADEPATDATTTAADESGNNYTDPATNAAISKDTSTTWQADTTQTPLELLVFTRLYTPGSSAYRYLFGRKLTFSPNGRLLEMSGEQALYRIRGS